MVQAELVEPAEALEHPAPGERDAILKAVRAFQLTSEVSYHPSMLNPVVAQTWHATLLTQGLALPHGTLRPDAFGLSDLRTDVTEILAGRLKDPNFLFVTADQACERALHFWVALRDTPAAPMAREVAGKVLSQAGFEPALLDA